MSDLIKHIEEVNRKGAEWANEPLPEGSFRCAAVYSTSPEYWAEYKVFTPADFDRCCALSELSDYHKDCHGYRPRDIHNLTMDEIQERLDSLSRYADSMQEQWAEEAEWDAERDAQYEEEDRIELAESTGDFTAVNDEHRDEYATEQAPLGSLDLVL